MIARLTTASALAASLAACGPSPSTSQPTELASSDVELIEGETALDPASIVFTNATILDPTYVDAGQTKTFATSVVKTAEAKYIGYLLGAQSTSRGFVASGKLKAFTGRYERTETATWTSSGVTPSHPDVTVKDLKEVASSPVAVELSSASARAGNVRVYKSRIRTAWSATTGYTYERGLLIFLVRPSDGRRAAFMYSPSGAQRGLYKLASGAVPASKDGASLVNVVKAADVTVAIKPGSPERYMVPLHNFVSESFRVVGGTSYRGRSTPFGPALPLTATESALLSALSTATAASSAQTDAIFALVTGKDAGQ